VNATGRSWAYAGAVLGGAVSIAANVAHSYVPPQDARPGWSPEVGAVTGSTFWPIALFVAVEILARVPWPEGRRWSSLRFGGLLPVALVAAIVSYRHLSGLLQHYGEDSITCLIGPLAVDGLMVMATGALLATSPARRDPERCQRTEPGDAASGTSGPSTTSAPAETRDDFPSVPRMTAPPSTRRTGSRSSTARTRGLATAEAIARTRARNPQWTAAQIAGQIGVSARTVRRHLSTDLPADTDTSEVETPDTDRDMGADIATEQGEVTTLDLRRVEPDTAVAVETDTGCAA